jgi:hypothetical protein
MCRPCGSFERPWRCGIFTSMRSVDWRLFPQQRGTSPLFVRVFTVVITLTCNYFALTLTPPIFCCYVKFAGYKWGAVVVQPNCAVCIGRLGDVLDRTPADQRTADGRRRESTVPSRTARSAFRADAKDGLLDDPISNQQQRAALLLLLLHQAAQRLCRIRLLLKLVFRGLRSTAALASTPTTANAASAASSRRRTATTACYI